MILFLTTFFLIFALICAKNIRYGVYAVIFFMPLYLWRFSIFSIPTTALEIMIYILFLIWILNKIKKNNFYPALAEGFSGFSRSSKNGVLLTGITLLFLGVIISTFNSTDPRTSLGIFKGWFVDPFLFFLVFINIINRKEHILCSLKSWLASGVAVSLISIFYLLNNELTFDGRLKAFFLSPNHLAMYISPVFLIGLFFLFSKLSFPRRRESIAAANNGFGVIHNIKKISNFQYPICIVIIAIPLYFTYSYGAFLGIFAAVIYLFIFMIKSARSSAAFLRTLKYSIFNIQYSIFLVIIFISFIFITTVKFNQITNSENRSSFHSRLMIWNSAKEIIKDNPLFGIGPGTFQETYLSYADRFQDPYLEWAVPQPHNIFLAFYLQTGLIGFIGFILILSWFFNYRRDEAMPRLYRQVINILMIYILVHGLVDTTYWKNDLSLIFWLIIGMAVVIKKINEKTIRK